MNLSSCLLVDSSKIRHFRLKKMVNLWRSTVFYSQHRRLKEITIELYQRKYILTTYLTKWIDKYHYYQQMNKNKKKKKIDKHNTNKSYQSLFS